MVLSFLPIHSKVKDASTGNWYESYLEFVDLWTGLEWNWRLFRICDWSIKPRYILLNQLQFILSAFRLQASEVDRIFISTCCANCQSSWKWIYFLKCVQIQRDVDNNRGKVDVYRITRFRRLLKHLPGKVTYKCWNKQAGRGFITVTFPRNQRGESWYLYYHWQ